MAVALKEDQHGNARVAAETVSQLRECRRPGVWHGGGMRRLLRAPTFSDPAKTREARILFFVLVNFIAVVSALMIAAFFVLPANRTRWITIATTLDAGSIVLLAVNSRGWVRQASAGFVIEIWLAVSIAALTTGGMRAAAINGFVVVVFSAGMLLGQSAGIFAGIVCSLTGLCFVFAEEAGILPASSVQHTSFSLWLVNALYISLVVNIQYLAASTLKQALSSAHRELLERGQVEENLLRHQQQLQSLSSRLLVIEERQRRSFSQMLHDHIGQNLTYAKMKLSMLHLQPANSEETAATVSELIKLVDQLSQETRSLTYEMSPPLLYEIGLDAALEWLGEHFQSRYDLPCSFEGSSQRENLEIDARVILFQAARELLFNVIKHARAKSAKISCVRNAERVYLTVSDDGIGFNPSRAFGNSSFGLFSIRERLEHAGGAVEINSRIGGGAGITLQLPIRLKDK
jgi:signal transduction histidine kinase